MKKKLKEFILANLEYNRGRWPQAWRLERVRKEWGLSKREVRKIEDEIQKEFRQKEGGEITLSPVERKTSIRLR